MADQSIYAHTTATSALLPISATLPYYQSRQLLPYYQSLQFLPYYQYYVVKTIPLRHCQLVDDSADVDKCHSLRANF